MARRVKGDAAERSMLADHASATAKRTAEIAERLALVAAAEALAEGGGRVYLAWTEIVISPTQSASIEEAP